MTDALTIRRGVNFDVYLDSYTDPTNTTRIDYDGWRFTVTLAVTGQPDTTWSTDDPTPALTVIDATSGPTGKRLAFHLDATATAAITTGGHLTLLRIDPNVAANVELIAGPVPVNIAQAP